MTEPAQPGITRGAIDLNVTERRMLDHVHEKAVLRLEGRLLIHTRLLTHALDQVMKTFTIGYSGSSLTGVTADLRHAANSIESVNRDWQTEKQAYDGAVRGFENLKAEAKET